MNPPKTQTKNDTPYRVNQLYELTIAPENQYDRDKHFGRIQMLAANVSKALKNIDAQIAYQVRWEVTEPWLITLDNIPRYHIHGTFEFKGIKGLALFLDSGYRSLAKIGRTTINTYRPEKWPDYLEKQRVMMEPLCAVWKVPYIMSNSVGYDPDVRVGIMDFLLSEPDDNWVDRPIPPIKECTKRRTKSKKLIS